MGTDDVQPTKVASKKSAIVMGGFATLAVGVLIGMIAMKYAGHVPTAAAATKGPSTASPIAATTDTNSTGSAAWNPFQDLWDTQLRMDQMFDQMTTRFRGEPRFSLFQDSPGYSLSLHVQDLKDHFEVRAFLPNAKASDVNVNLVGKQTLKVEVSNKTTEAPAQKSGNGTITEWGQYSQTIQLPSPVKSEQMKIDNQNHELLITLPKA